MKNEIKVLEIHTDVETATIKVTQCSASIKKYKRNGNVRGAGHGPEMRSDEPYATKEGKGVIFERGRCTTASGKSKNINNQTKNCVKACRLAMQSEKQNAKMKPML